MIEQPTTLTVAEVAEAKGVDPTTVRRHCARGIIPGAVKPGHDWIIPMEGAEQYMLYVPYQALRRPPAGSAPAVHRPAVEREDT